MKTNPVHRCAALQLRPRHGSPTKRERAAGSRSVTVHACFQWCPRQCFENCELYKFLLSLSFFLSPSLFLSFFLSLLAPFAYIRTYKVDRSLFLSSTSRTLKLVSVSHGLSVVPALLVHALLVAGNSSRKRTWIWICFLLVSLFLIFLSKN